MNEIYLAKNHLMIKTEYKDPEMHRHSAAHILISLKGPVRFQVDGQEMTGFGAVIPSGLPHTVCGAPDEEGKPFSMPSLLLFLFDETTFVAQCIRESRLITEKQAQTVLQWYRDMREAADAASAYPSFLRKVLKELGLSDSLQAVGDERIRQAYVYIDEHIGSDMTVASIASHFCMSESRFSHLFRKEAGMSVANYLVFRKLYFTYLGLMKGKNITTAALDAGFSDPSHFAATNKRMFGIPPTAVSGSMKIITIAEI
ncbi:MAG: helix-turn-helix domain-containing protein [Bacteroides sp.]